MEHLMVLLLQQILEAVEEVVQMALVVVIPLAVLAVMVVRVSLLLGTRIQATALAI